MNGSSEEQKREKKTGAFALTLISAIESATATRVKSSDGADIDDDVVRDIGYS